MDGLRFTVAAHFAGTLTADQQGVIRLPCPATLVEVAAGATNATAATLKVGTPADDDGILAAKTVGQNSAPNVYGRGQFDGALMVGVPLMHFAKGDRLMWFLDFDGAAGTAAANGDLLFTFVEG